VRIGRRFFLLQHVHGRPDHIPLHHILLRFPGLLGTVLPSHDSISVRALHREIARYCVILLSSEHSQTVSFHASRSHVVCTRVDVVCVIVSLCVQMGAAGGYCSVVLCSLGADLHGHRVRICTSHCEPLECRSTRPSLAGRDTRSPGLHWHHVHPIIPVLLLRHLHQVRRRRVLLAW
jgi:hypothetical protein